MAPGLIHLSGSAIPTIASQNSPLLLLKKQKEDFDITIIILFLSHVTSVCVITFSTAQHTFLTLRHPGRTCIKFLQLHVPHVLQHDEDPMAKDFVGT